MNCQRAAAIIRRANSQVLIYVASVLAGEASREAVAGVSYQITDLGALVDLGGRTDSRPYAINATGQIALTNVSGGRYRALRYDGALLDLGTLGGNEALAFNINNGSQVVGRSLTADGKTRAFLWTPGGTDGVASNPQMRNLGTLGSGDQSEAFAINASGQVVGYSDTGILPATNQQHAFLYTNGTMEDLGGLMGSPNSFAYGINSAGHVTGTAYNPFYTISRGFYYDGNRMNNIGSLGGLSTNAIAINDSDRIVGWSEVITGPDLFVDHAFLYDDGKMHDLGTLGGNYSYALGINSQNVVVGGAFTDLDDTNYHAFVYADGMMENLNTLAGAEALGWVLEEARAINDIGQITGTGVRNGQSHGFLLTPNTLQPSIVIVKTGDMLGSLGNEVNYTITLDNTSSMESPNLSCDINDSLLGLVADDVNLASGGQHVVNVSRTVQAGDPDPLVNTATTTCQVDGFPNVLEASDNHTVNLFQPSIAIVKTGDALSRVGDEVNYTITLDNTSSTDSPNLSCDINDSLLGLVADDVNLASGGQHVVNVSRTVQAGDPDPLVNTATATCQVDGFPNVLEASDNHTVDLTPPPVPGDINLDEFVDRTDVSLFVAHFGTSIDANWSQGDFNEDRIVSLLDLALQQSHLSTAGSPNAVPEPRFGWLVVVIFLTARCGTRAGLSTVRRARQRP